MDDYKKRFARTLAETEAIFFDEGLILKDGRPTPYVVNMAMFRTGRFNSSLCNINFLVRDLDSIAEDRTT